MATGFMERATTYHYKLRVGVLDAFYANTQRLLGKQLMDGRTYTVCCGPEFVVLNMQCATDHETTIQRLLVTLKHYEDAFVGEYVDFEALIATDRQLGVVIPHLNEHWLFGIEYFDLGPGMGTVKCWRRLK